MTPLLKFALIISSGLSLIAGASTPATAKDDGKGTVVVKVDPNSSGIKYARKYGLGVVVGDSFIFHRFEGDESEALEGTAKGKGSKKKMPILKTEDGYLSINVKPGRYFLSSVVHQTHWAICLNDQTVLFDVKPNIATHIGMVDVSGVSGSIKSNVRISKHNKVKETDGIEYYYTDTKKPLKFTPPSSTDLQDAAEALKKADPFFNGAIIAANSRPFTFRTKVRSVKTDLGGYKSTSVNKCGK